MSRNDLATLIGSVAGVITVLSFVPQAVRAWRTKSTRDLSAGTFILLVVQAGGWMTYGILLEQKPMIYTNGVLMALTMSILAAKVRHGDLKADLSRSSPAG